MKRKLQTDEMKNRQDSHQNVRLIKSVKWKIDQPLRFNRKSRVESFDLFALGKMKSIFHFTSEKRQKFQILRMKIAKFVDPMAKKWSTSNLWIPKRSHYERTNQAERKNFSHKNRIASCCWKMRFTSFFLNWIESNRLRHQTEQLTVTLSFRKCAN